VSGTEPGGRRLAQLDRLGVEVLHRVGPRTAERLGELGVRSVLDLLCTYPRRYIDRTRQADLADLAVGDEAVVLATVRRTRQVRGARGKPRVEVLVHDGTGGMQVVFFNQPWRARQLVEGAEALFFGKLESYRDQRQMTNPVVDLLSGVEEGGAPTRTGRVVPVYPASARAGLNSWEIHRYVQEALDRAGRFLDPLPSAYRAELDLVDRTTAYREIHGPASVQATEPARRRLAFDELFRLQLAVVLRRRAVERDARGVRHRVGPASPDGDPLVTALLAALPFRLTDAQRRAQDAIFADMAGPLPMHRLLQGDVGSGKTLVALLALVGAVQGGHQGALMVPTEVLAEQHHEVVGGLVGRLVVEDPERLGGRRPFQSALLTGRTPAAERASILAGLADGSVDLLVGTHALLTQDVDFHSLGVVVIDEQHRFGVEQRAALREKAGADRDPDLLVMTATPIPRTAAMVLFGDLDMTVLDELPPGRRPVRTQWVRTPLEEHGAWARVRNEVAVGHRAYVVCPLVEGSAKVEARSAVAERDRLAGEALRGLELGLLHGQMSAAEKEAAMAAFRAGDTPVLVATTVVEVGVDVPEATVMVIEDAARFGIAQLHQLRGRVGRGGTDAWCFLLGAAPGRDAEVRLRAVESTTDGFALAEVDLDQRGEGSILGVRQKGRSDLRLAELSRDRQLLLEARRVAQELVSADVRLEAHPELARELALFLDPEEEAFLFKS